MTLRASLVLAAALVAGAACSRSDPAPTAPAPRPVATTPPPPLHPTLPSEDGPFAPSQASVRGEGLDGALVTETESCAGCHAETAAEWRASAHAFASFNNPVYRVAIDRFRAVVGKDASRFCAGCHDVALLVDGAMSSDVAPSDARGHGGVTCRVCHGIDETRTDGNGSYVLSASPVPIPREGDAESVRLHKARMALAPLRTAEMCGTCHRSFLGPGTGNPAHLVGMDELSGWSQSAYAGSHGARVDAHVEPAACKDCHMPKVVAERGDAAMKDGKVSSHRFLGAHTWLAAMRGDARTLADAQAMLRGAASIDVPVAMRGGVRVVPAAGMEVAPGDAIVLDVVVRNARVGHRFPGGTLDAEDVWVQVEVRDARGALVASAGDDASAHRLRALQADEDGQPVLGRETDRFRAAVYNHTIPARDAELVRYAFDVPRTLGADALPLRVTARLRHRTRNAGIQEQTCADLRTPRGRAFAAEVRRRTGEPFDPCAPEPVTDVAETTIALGGAGDDARGRDPLPERLFDHALGALHALQEQADDARPSLDRALTDLPEGDAAARARVAALYAQVAARQARTDETMDWLAKAVAWDAGLEGHPALARTRGEALAAVWRWRESIAPLDLAARASPRDDHALALLAVSLASANEAALAESAAARGLLLQPRDESLLRVQALALGPLGADPADVAMAADAYAAFRAPDDAPRTRARCSKSVPGCALERVPVHVHALRAAR